AGGLECVEIAVLDRGDIGRPDVQLALHIEKRFAECCPLAAENIAQPEFEIIEPARTFLLLRRRLFLAPDHLPRPLTACSYRVAFLEGTAPRRDERGASRLVTTS